MLSVPEPQLRAEKQAGRQTGAVAVIGAAALK